MTARMTIPSPPGGFPALWPTHADLYGLPVIGADGRDLGRVEDVVVTGCGTAVLWVTSGDAHGPDCLLIPSVAVATVTADAVYLDRAGADVVAAPRYDPAVPEAAFVGQLLRYYACPAEPAGDPCDRP